MTYRDPVGRTVRDIRLGLGTVIKYTPLGASMNDVLADFGGRRIWVSSHILRYEDGSRLPCRREVRADAEREKIEQLNQILGRLAGEIERGPRWFGMEFAKGHVAAMVIGAIRESGGTPMVDGQEVRFEDPRGVLK